MIARSLDFSFFESEGSDQKVSDREEQGQVWVFERLSVFGWTHLLGLLYQEPQTGSRSLGSRCQECWFTLSAVSENLLSVLGTLPGSQWLAGDLSCPLACRPRLSESHGAPPVLCLCVCPRHAGLGPAV